MHWRKTIRILHRDIGYTACALTVAYSISGLAVNHIDDWNPNYTFDDIPVQVGALPAGDLNGMEAQVAGALGIPAAEIRGRFLETATDFRLFLSEGQEVRIDAMTGAGVYKRIATRPVLYEVNALHLNSIKGVWTWVADVFAVALLLLAITGLFILKGQKGLMGRGKWFVGAGLAIPAGFIAYLYYGG